MPDIRHGRRYLRRVPLTLEDGDFEVKATAGETHLGARTLTTASSTAACDLMRRSEARTWQATSGLSQTQHDDITDELTAAAIHVAWTSGQLGGSAMVYDMDHSAARPPSCVLCTSSWRSSSNFTSRRVMMPEMRKKELACRMMVFSYLD